MALKVLLVDDEPDIRKIAVLGSSGNRGGTGLGLAISKALVELHGGTEADEAMP